MSDDNGTKQTEDSRLTNMKNPFYFLSFVLFVIQWKDLWPVRTCWAVFQIDYLRLVNIIIVWKFRAWERRTIDSFKIFLHSLHFYLKNNAFYRNVLSQQFNRRTSVCLLYCQWIWSTKSEWVFPKRCIYQGLCNNSFPHFTQNQYLFKHCRLSADPNYGLFRILFI